MSKVEETTVKAEIIRREIAELISSIIPFDQQEKEHIDFVRNWIASGVENFSDRQTR
jgi:hypothetical protein